MDNETNSVRRASWLQTIQACQHRPDGITARQWLEENRINIKSYYYWLRKFRKESACQPELPVSQAPAAKEISSVTFAEIPTASFSSREHSTAVIRIGNASIELSESVSDAMLIRILKAVSYVS